ncbi:MAG: AAA family ATPase [Bacteroides sp.]
MRTSTPRKRIPYGIMDFTRMLGDNCYYVDKTRFIEEVEQANSFFFYIRPRRFGKSLTLSMLRHYYDVKEADRFKDWYEGLYIYTHPTPERAKYLVLNLNFALVNAELGSYQQALDAHCSLRFNSFCDTYADLLPEGTKEGMNQQTGAVSQLDYLCEVCVKKGLWIYLFIDEYDHFTNKILSSPEMLEAYKSETHGTGYLRLFFDTVKGGTDRGIRRCFITGVSPVTLDDMTSGFNIGTNYSLSPQFNEMTGFTEAEVRAMLDYYATTCEFHHTTDELIALMKPWYDNYCFARQRYGRTTMYNTCMVLYFVDNYIRNGGQLPCSMLEDNVRIDYEKLRMLIRKDKEFAHDASIIQTLAEQGYVTGQLKTSFPAEQVTASDCFISLLFYFGMLTIGGEIRGKSSFVIPNQVVREQLFNYLLDTYNEIDLQFKREKQIDLAADMAFDGDWKSYFNYIAECLSRFASQRDRQKGEAFVHGFSLAMTAQNPFYRPVSEMDTQSGYADLFLHPLLEIYKEMQHSYVIELKYAKGREPQERVEQLHQEAIGQAIRYAATDTVQQAIGHTTLHRLVVVFHGMEMAVCEEV